MFVSKKHVVFLCVLLLVACVGSSAQVRTPDQMLVNPDPRTGSRTVGRTTRTVYSQLKQVTAANASRLQAKWVYHLDGMEELEFTPLVLNGVMYVSGFTASTRSTPHRKYHLEVSAPASFPHTTARHCVYGDKVYVATSDSHLVALDARTGVSDGT